MYTYRDIEAEIISGLGRVYYTPAGPMPSITTVLGHTAPEEKKNALSAWRDRIGHAKADQVGKDAADRGTNVHLMLERAMRNEDPRCDDFPESHVKVYKSLRLELKKITSVYGQEAALYSETLQVAGRCDMIGEYKGEPAIIDYKTSTRVKNKDEIQDYWHQTAFYAVAHNEMFGTDIKKLVILMGIENNLPMIFKKELDDELMMQLVIRIHEFMNELAK